MSVQREPPPGGHRPDAGATRAPPRWAAEPTASIVNRPSRAAEPTLVMQRRPEWTTEQMPVP